MARRSCLFVRASLFIAGAQPGAPEGLGPSPPPWRARMAGLLAAWPRVDSCAPVMNPPSGMAAGCSHVDCMTTDMVPRRRMSVAVGHAMRVFSRHTSVGGLSLTEPYDPI